MNTPNLSPAEFEALCAYLDGELSEKERRHLESRLQAKPELRSALEGLQKTRAVLRAAPRLRAPRNFTLTPEMAGIQTKRTATLGARLYPVMRASSALASVLFVLVVAGELFLGSTRLAARQVAMEPVLEMAPAAKEMAAPEAPAETVVVETEAELFSGAADTAMATPLPTMAAKMPVEGVGGGEAYPALTEEPPAAPAASELTFPAPLTPTPEAYPHGTQLAEAPPISMQAAPSTPAAQVELAQQAPVDAENVTSEAGSTATQTWRWVELFLAALALSSGLAALLLRPRRL